MEMDARWRALRFWLAPARGLLAVDALASRRCLLVRAPRPSEASALRLRGLRDALVLLALLAKTDRVALEQALVEGCGVLDARTELAAPDGALPAVFSLDGGGGWDCERLLALLGDSNAAPSNGLLELLIKAGKGSRALLTTIQYLEVPIVVDVKMSSKEGWDPSLRALLALRDKHKGWRFPFTVTQGSKSAFVMTAGSIEVCGEDVPEDVAADIEEFVANAEGLLLTALEIEHNSAAEATSEQVEIGKAAARAGQFYERLLCSSDRPVQELARIDTLSIAFKDTGDLNAVFPRLCTALAEARTVKSIELTVGELDSEEACTRYWRFVAHAFFSKHARLRSSISHALLGNVVMKDAHVSAMMGVIEAYDPVRCLGGMQLCCPRSPQTSTKAIIKRGAQIILHPADPFESLTSAEAGWMMRSNATCWCNMDYRSSSVAMALIPGYGVCRVDCEDLMLIGHSNAGIGLEGGISSLDIEFHQHHDDMPECNFEGLPRFLLLVGSSLTTLKLSNLDKAFDVMCVICNCSRLESLTLSGANINAEEFLEGYRQLGVGIKNLSCEFDTVAPLLKELANRGSLFAWNITHFESWASNYGYALHTPEDLDATSNMLRCNRTLQYARLSVASWLYSDVSKIAECHQGELMPAPQAPYSLSCKLAFLSIFGNATSSKQKYAKRAKLDKALIPRLDRHVITSIFDFAAERRRRQIELVWVQD